MIYLNLKFRFSYWLAPQLLISLPVLRFIVTRVSTLIGEYFRVLNLYSLLNELLKKKKKF